MRKMLCPYLALPACICVLQMGSLRVQAAPTAVAFPNAIVAAATLCPVFAIATNHAAQLADELQSETIGPVSTCSNRLRSVFLDAVALPQLSGYPGDADIMPAFFIQPAGASDFVQAVQFAAANNLTIAVKSGGYSWRNLWRADRGLTVDLSAMNAVHVDAAEQEISVQGGAIYADILAATDPYGLALPWGDAAQTGMGLALGGGIGYLLRPYGLTADNIINATVVLANGTQVMANAANNANLLAAMRGGGTLFGVVTEVAFKVYNVSDYHGGVITYEDDTNCTTLRAAHDWAVKALAQESSLGVEILAFSSTPGQHLVEVQVGMQGSVPDDIRQDIIAPLQKYPNAAEGSLDTLNYTAFEQTVTAFAEAIMYKSTYFISQCFPFNRGNTISDNAVRNTSSFTGFGGAIDMHFFIKYEWPAGVNEAANSAFCQDSINLMTPYVTSTQPYYNLATVVNNATLEYQVGGASKLAELRQLKGQLDPHNLFRRHGLVGL